MLQRGLTFNTECWQDRHNHTLCDCKVMFMWNIQNGQVYTDRMTSDCKRRGEGLPRWCSGKESTCQCRRHQRHGFGKKKGGGGDMGLISGLERSLKEGNGKPFQYSGLEKFRGQRSLASYSLWGCRQSDTTQRARAHTHRARGKGYYGITDNRFKNTLCGYIFLGTSLLVQWLRIHLSMQGTQVQTLLQNDPMCHVATITLSHNYWSLHTLEPVLCNKRSHCNEKPTHVAPAHHN